MSFHFFPEKHVIIYLYYVKADQDSNNGSVSNSFNHQSIATHIHADEEGDSEGEIHSDGEEWTPGKQDKADSDCDEPRSRVKEKSEKGKLYTCIWRGKLESNQ